MRPYFEKMTPIGKALKESKIKQAAENVAQIKEVESLLAAEIEKARNAGLPAKKINERGQLTVFQRLEKLIDPGTWCPLHTIFNPTDNEE